MIYFRSSAFMDNSKYQLMYNAVQPISINPLHETSLERYNHIVVDVIDTKHYKNVNVIYVATDRVVKKITVLPRTQETCLVETWNVIPPDSSERIRSANIFKDTVRYKIVCCYIIICPINTVKTEICDTFYKRFLYVMLLYWCCKKLKVSSLDTHGGQKPKLGLLFWVLYTGIFEVELNLESGSGTQDQTDYSVFQCFKNVSYLNSFPSTSCYRLIEFL